MTDAPELLPCPFCGESAHFERIGDRRASTIVACTMCGCRHECGEEWNHGSSWNTRAPDPRVAALVEALGDVADESLSDEIPEGYGPDLTENPEFHRGYDAALHRVRIALAAFKGGADG